MIDNLLGTNNCSRLWDQNASLRRAEIAMAGHHNKHINKGSRSAVENIKAVKGD